MPEYTRVFVAIAVPEPLERKLARLTGRAGSGGAGLPVDVGPPFHLTLAFLGDVPDRDLDTICRGGGRSTAESIDPFDIDVTGLGAFPSPTRPRVIWAGVTAPEPQAAF